MTTAQNPGAFSDDAPKTELRQDKLGVQPFAKRFAEVIIKLPAPNGYVIGLHGTWGSGKTSAINFVRRYIDKYNAEKIEGEPNVIWLEFRPWMAAGYRDLTSAFFKVLKEQLKLQSKRWLRKLKSGRAVSDAVLDSADKLSWLTAHAHGGTIPVGLKAAKGGINALVDALAREPSLQQEHDTLADYLRESESKLLVVIDDLDRLRKDEIQQMMMMVKTIGQLPNVIYLLAYDQRIVWDALAEGDQPTSRLSSYAEKIIQQEVALPSPAPNRLLELFQAEIGFLPELPDAARQRIASLVTHALNRWLRTPRDVLRFVNNLRFAWAGLAEYLDPVDYIAIEGLRTFDKQAFSFIRDNHDFFFPPVAAWHHDDTHKMQAVERFRAVVPPTDLADLTTLLGMLFPHRKAAFKHTPEERKTGKLTNSGFGEAHSEVRRRRGLGFQESFETYFQLYPPGHLPSLSVIDNFMARLADEAWLFRALDEAQGQVRSGNLFTSSDLMDDVRSRILSPNTFSSDRQSRSSVALLRAIVRVFDAWSTKTLPMFSLSPLRILLLTVLEDLPQQQTTDALAELFLGDVSAGTAAYLVVAMLERMGAMRSSAQELYTLIGRPNGDRLAKLVVDRLEVMKVSEFPPTHAVVMDVLRLWEHVRGREAPQKWVAENLSDPVLFLKLAGLFVLQDESAPWRPYRRSPDDDENADRFFDMTVFEQTGERLRAEAPLGVVERAKVDALLAWLDERPDDGEPKA